MQEFIKTRMTSFICKSCGYSFKLIVDKFQRRDILKTRCLLCDELHYIPSIDDTFQLKNIKDIIGEH